MISVVPRCAELGSLLTLQGGLVLDKEGSHPDMPLLRVMFREEHLVGSMVNKFELQVLDPLQFKCVLILQQCHDAITNEGMSSEGTVDQASIADDSSRIT